MSTSGRHLTRKSTWDIHIELNSPFSNHNFNNGHGRSKIVTGTDVTIESMVRQIAEGLELEAHRGWIADTPVVYGDAELITCDVYDDTSKVRKKGTVFAWRNVWTEEN